MKHNVPIQSLIDHIKTAIDVDPWAKEMAEELLKEQEAVLPCQHDAVWFCGNCGEEIVGWHDDIDGKEYHYPFCRQCGKGVKWNESAAVAGGERD